MGAENNIPAHWQLKKLGEVCHTTSGGTPSRGNSNYYTGNIPWVKSGELDRGLILDTEEKISDEAIKNSSAKIFPKGTLLIALYGATIGKLAFLGIDAATNQAVCGIFENEKIESKYLYYFLSYKRPSLVQQGIGGAQPNISQGILKNLDLPIPPLEEQRAIVSKIEELFSELDNGKQQLETAQQQLKVYRQSLLKAAFEGKLTNKNVKDGELPEGWKTVSLNSVSKVVSGFAFKSSDFVATGIPVIKISNIGYSEFIWKDQQYLPSRFLNDNSDFIIQGGDLLIALTRPITNNTTKVCLYPSTAEKALLNQRVACIRDLKVNGDFIYLFFQTNIFKEYIRSKFSETLQPNLSPKDLALTPIPIPPIEEQQLIVNELESKLTVCDKIEETITQSLQQAETLRQSILKKAFEGKLVNAENLITETQPA